MKKILPLFLALLLLGGCVAPAEATPQPTLIESPVPAEKEETGRPVLDYQTVATGYTIQRIKLDPKGLGLNVYFEIPAFEKAGVGYEKINAFFVELANSFFSPDNPNLKNIWDAACDGRADLYYKWTAQVTCWSDKLVSVTLSSIWLAGGVKSYQINGYTFRTDTGEQLSLEDVTGQSAEKIKKEIINTLALVLDERGSDPERSLAEAEKYDLKDFDYGLDKEGFVQIYFDSDELGRTTAESDLTIYPWLFANWKWGTGEPLSE